MKKKIVDVLKDLDKNHNHSLWREIFNRNKENLEKTAIIYKSKNISYKEMFDNIDMYAAALTKMGYKKGDVIPVCMSNMPEFAYLFLAISKIGCAINTFGTWLNPEYLKEIINSTGSKHVFVSDDNYEAIKDVIDASNAEKTVMFSLNDSLPLNKEGNKYNPYEKIDAPYISFDNKTEKFKKENDDIIETSEFNKMGAEYMSENCKGYTRNFLEADVNLDDDFTISYTSGTTNPGFPKAVLHPIRSYMTISRFKDKDVSGMGEMKNLKVLSHIPTYVHAALTTCYSDPFFEKCSVIMEPVYDKDYFPYSVIMNKPNYVCAGTGFWSNLGKKLMFDEKFKNVKMPYLMLPTVTGEGMSIGEEKFFNKVSRKHKFGTTKLPFPLAPVSFSIGGGTSENSGVFVTLFKAVQEKRLNYLLKGKQIGLTPFKFEEVEVLDEYGKPCKIGEYGSLVLNGPCDMKKYLYDESLNDGVKIKDATDKEWHKMGCYAVKQDNFPHIVIKGRMKDKIILNDGSEYPLFKLEDAVLKDTKNIMSCTAVVNNGEIVLHIELQPDSKLYQLRSLGSIIERLENFIPEEVLYKTYIRMRSTEESFPLAPSGKRNQEELAREDISKALKIKEKAKALTLK